MATVTKERAPASAANTRGTEVKGGAKALPTKTSTGKLVPAKAGTSSTKAVGSTGSKSPATANQSATPKKPAGSGKFFFGMMVYLLAAQVLQIGGLYLDAKFGWNLNNPKTHKLFDLPILGAVTPFTLIFLGLLAVLLWALYKFNILPTNRQLAAATAAQRAARESARTTAASKATTPAKPGAKGKSMKVGVASKNAPAAKVGAVTKAGTTKPSTAGKPTATTKSATVSAKGATKNSDAVSAGENDDMYDRVRAYQRTQARKARKR